MKKKLTEMNTEELVAYRKKAERKQKGLKQGSKKWLKCQTRINRATLYLRTIHN